VKSISEYVVARPAAEDRPGWAVLYREYAKFTGMPMTDEMLDRVWTWLLDETEGLRGLVVRQANGLVALAHYRIHVRPMSATRNLYVHDLYVNSPDRRQGVGTQLMDALIIKARKGKCASVYWHTKEENQIAQSFYGRFTKRMTWVAYEIEL
jgi:ribosomal protein S18 acetylase RimI-like enzyme